MAGDWLFGQAYPIYKVYNFRYPIMTIRKVLAIAAMASGLLVSPAATAQVNPVLADEFGAEIEATRTLLQTERKMLVMQQMALTAEEAEAFWPLYDEYLAERKKVGDLRVKVISDYAANYLSMTDELAKALRDDMFRFQEQDVKLRRKYAKKFRRVVSDIQVTRLVQLENKLDALINADLATQIPLMQ